MAHRLPGFLTRWLDAFLFSSLFLALCAAGMVYQTLYLFHLPIDYSLLGFAFCGTICSYNFHWFFTPASFGGSRKTLWSVRHRTTHAVLFVWSLFAAIWFGWDLREHWLLLLLTAGITFLYSAPKVPHHSLQRLQKIAIGKTLFLAFAWAHVTALLPQMMFRPLPDGQGWVFFLNRFLLIYAICILFDYRDREADKKEGIRSLLTHLEHKGIQRLFWAVLILFLFSSAGLFYLGMPALLVVSLALPGFLVAALWPYSLRHHNDYLYYLVLDGLMALSVPLVCFF